MNVSWGDVRIGSSFFSDFLREGSHKVRDLTKPDFWHFKSYVGSAGPKKVPKMTPKMRVLRVLTKIKSIHMYFFYLNGKVPIVFWLSAKTSCPRKIFFLSHGPKIVRPIRIQYSSNYSVRFCIWLQTHRSNKFTQSFQVGVVRSAWACSKLCQIVI